MAIILTGVALICIVAGQIIWLYQSYRLHYALFDKYANRMLTNAVEEEFDIRSKVLLDHIVITQTEDSLDMKDLDSIAIQQDMVIPSNTNTIIDLKHPLGGDSNLQSRIKYALNYASPPSIQMIDSIYSSLIKLEYPGDEIYVELVNASGDTIIQSTANVGEKGRRYVTDPVPLDDDSNQAVRGVVVSSSFFRIFTQTTGTMAVSVFFALLAVACTLYIIQVVFKQKKYTQSVTDYTHYTVHQMQTPIMLATLSLKRLHTKSRENKNFEVEPYIDISEKNLKKLSSLSDSLLSLAVQEHSNMKITRETFDIVDSIQTLANEMSLKSQDKQINITIDNRLTNLEITADRLHLCNAVGNLIDNAVKYSSSVVDIRIKLEDISEGIRIIVEDNGLGIDEEHIDRIFDRFYRVGEKPDGRTPAKGFGLGLCYVRAVCEAHGGSVRVQSQKGVGSKFVMDIPLG